MDPRISEVLSSGLGAKKKVKALAEGLRSGAIAPAECVRALSEAPSVDRGTLVESLESATRVQPELVDGDVFRRLVECLADEAPRVRWEAARTVGNVAAQHPGKLAPAVEALLANTTHEGSVVRWATAHALAAILEAGHDPQDLRGRIQEIVARESDDGVRKVYEKALRSKR